MVARDAIRRALRRLGVLTSLESLSVQDETQALEALNDMLAALPAGGLTYTHTTLTATSALTTDPSLDQAIVSLLALRLADDFAPEALTPALLADASRARGMLAGKLLAVPASSFDLPRTS